MQHDRELAKAICVAAIRHLAQAAPGQPSSPASVTVDLAKLRTWLDQSPRSILEPDVLEAAVGYNNFYLEVVADARSSSQ